MNTVLGLKCEVVGRNGRLPFGTTTRGCLDRLLRLSAREYDLHGLSPRWFALRRAYYTRKDLR